MELNAAEKICQRSKPDNLAARNEAQAAAISRFYQNQRCPEEQPSCEKTAVLLRNLDASTALFIQFHRGASGTGNAWCSYMQGQQVREVEIHDIEMGARAKSKSKKSKRLKTSKKRTWSGDHHQGSQYSEPRLQKGTP